MRVLILTVSAGEGHNSISKAIADYLRNYSGRDDVDVKIYDLFKGTSKFKAYVVNEGYFWTCKYFMGISNAFYEQMKVRDPRKNKDTIVHTFTKTTKPDVEAIVKEYLPDVVFCSHVYAAHIMSEFKSRGITDLPVISIVSDYDVPPYIEICTDIDYLVVPCADLNGELVRRGIAEEKLLNFGIPAFTKFSKSLDKREMRRELGLCEDKFTVMMMNGGIGFGSTVKLIENICRCNADFQIVSVCGRNKSLKKQIDRLNCAGKFKKKIVNIGYADNVDRIMSASDVLIGKLGGVSLNEAFNKRLPVIATTRLPWQEYDNMVYLKKQGACDYIEDPKRACEVLELYIENPEKLAKMADAVEKLRRPHAARDIGEFIIQCAEKAAARK